MIDPRAREAAFNASSREQWAQFSEHRERVSRALGAGEREMDKVRWSGGLRSDRPRLCVLGAGNCNDLNLGDLLTCYSEVHLVDVDPVALEQGARRQVGARPPYLNLHGGIDVSMFLDRFATWTPLTDVTPADLAALADWPSLRVPLALPGPFDVVGSTCLLRPLIGNSRQSLSARHTEHRKVVAAIRLGHLKLMNSLLVPGGRGVIITDVASSDTYPPIVGQNLPAGRILHYTLLDAGGYLEGVNPDVILSTLRELVSKSIRYHGTWKWQLHDRTYLVQGLSFVRT